MLVFLCFFFEGRGEAWRVLARPAAACVAPPRVCGPDRCPALRALPARCFFVLLDLWVRFAFAAREAADVAAAAPPGASAVWPSLPPPDKAESALRPVASGFAIWPTEPPSVLRSGVPDCPPPAGRGTVTVGVVATGGLWRGRLPAASQVCRHSSRLSGGFWVRSRRHRRGLECGGSRHRPWVAWAAWAAWAWSSSARSSSARWSSARSSSAAHGRRQLMISLTVGVIVTSRPVQMSGGVVSVTPPHPPVWWSCPCCRSCPSTGARRGRIRRERVGHRGHDAVREGRRSPHAKDQQCDQCDRIARAPRKLMADILPRGSTALCGFSHFSRDFACESREIGTISVDG